jgi:peptide/nickel transport system ATP-binding protein
VQAQIFDLLREQQERRGTAIVMITHDMGVVAEMSDQVVVMYGGRVIEKGATDQVLASPRHPYTQGLISCLPELDINPGTQRADLPEIPGVVPSVWNRGQGCPFADRCKSVMEKCREAFPPWRQTGSMQEVACWLYEDQS